MLLKILAVEIKQPYMIKLDENSPQLFKTGSNLAWQTYSVHVVIGLIEFEDYDTLLHGFHGMMCLPAEPLNIVPSSRPFDNHSSIEGSHHERHSFHFNGIFICCTCKMQADFGDGSPIIIGK